MVCAVGFSFDLAEIAFGGMLSAIFSGQSNPIDQGLLAWLLAAPSVGHRSSAGWPIGTGSGRDDDTEPSAMTEM